VLTLDELKAKIEKLPEGSALAAELSAILTSATEAALLDTRRKLNKENESLRRRFKSVGEKFDLDLDDPELEAKIDALQKRASTGGDDGALARITKALGDVTKRLDVAERDKKELHRQNILGGARAKISAELQARGALRSRLEDLTSMLVGTTEINEDGTVALRINDQSMNLSEGVAAWLLPRKEFIESNLRPGAESGSHGGQGGAPEKDAAREKLSGSANMAEYLANRPAVVKP